MSVLTYSGTFNAQTSGATQAITGVGFTPKAIIFFWSGSTSIDTFQGGSTGGFGFCDDSFNGKSATHYEQDAQATATNTGRCGSALSLAFLKNSGTSVVADGKADVSAMGSDGFTITYTTNPSSAYNVCFIALGGDGIEGVHTGENVTGTTTGNVSNTLIGFQPDFILWTSASSSANGTVKTDGSTFSVGASDSNGNIWSTFNISEDNQANTYSGHNDSSTQVILGTDFGATSKTEQWGISLVSLNSNGYTFHVDTAPATTAKIYTLCLKGGPFKVGSIVPTATSVTNTNESFTGVGFKPFGLMLCNVMKNGGTPDNTNAYFALGAASSTTTEISALTNDDDGAATSAVNKFTSTADFMKYQDDAHKNGTTLDSDGGLNSFDSDGFTLHWDTRSAEAKRIKYIAFGSSAKIAVSESSGGTDSVTRAIVESRAESETASGSDTLSRAIVFSRPISESSGGTDSLSRSIVEPRAVSESSGGIDSLSVYKTVTSNISESSGGSDSLSRSLILGRAEPESSGGSDALSISQVLSRNIDEGSPINQEMNLSGVFSRSISESSGGSDSVVASSGAIVDITESISGADSITVHINALHIITESNTTTDTVDTQKNVFANISESVGGSATATPILFLTRSLSEGGELVDFVSRIAAYGRTAAESSGGTDTLGRSIVFDRILNETSGGIDNLSRIGSYSRIISEIVTTSNIVTGVRSRTAFIAENSGGSSDTLARALFLNRNQDEDIETSEIVNRSLILSRLIVGTEHTTDSVNAFSFVPPVSTSDENWFHNLYKFRRSINIQAPPTGLPAGHSISFSLPETMNTLQNKIRDDYEDIEILYKIPSSPFWTVLGRDVVEQNDFINITFNLSEDIQASNIVSGKYYIYYGNPSLILPPVRPIFILNEWPIHVEFNSLEVTFERPTEFWKNGVSIRPYSTASFEFYGTNIRLLSNIGTDKGKLQVQIDNGLWTEVDLFRATNANDVEVFAAEDLNSSLHRIHIRVMSKINPSALGTSTNIREIQYVKPYVVDDNGEEIFNKIFATA